MLAVAGAVFWHDPAFAGEKIEITPSTPSTRSVSPLAPRTPSRLDLDLDKLEGARIQTLQPGAPRMSIPAPSPSTAGDRKNKDWLVDSVAGDKPLDYNSILGVRDYSERPGSKPSRPLDAGIQPAFPGRSDGFSRRNDFGGFEPSRRDLTTGRPFDSSSGADSSSSRNSVLPENLGGLRNGFSADNLPSLPRSSDRDLEAYRSRSALKAEVDSILSRPDSRFANPLGNTLSVESILRPPGTPAPASARPAISQPTLARPTAAQEILRPVASPRDLSPAAAFAKENADALRPQSPKTVEPERRNDEPRYRPAVLPFPKRGF